jgi:DNA-binding XRE family transcriptional regulator
MTLAERLLNCRAKNGLTQAQLDRLLGVSSQTVYRLESGHKPRKVREIMIVRKLNELEGIENENVQM